MSGGPTCPYGCALESGRECSHGVRWEAPPDNLANDMAMSSIAHTIRTYYLALKAEGFTITEAITIAAAYQNSLLTTAATMPPIDAPNGPT